LKNKLDFPTDENFYLVKLQKTKIEKDIQHEHMKKKEGNWVLDCVNKNSSSLRYYNPLYDDHLNSFFASGTVRKQLRNKGFINTNGFIMYDSNYRSVMGSSPKRKTANENDKEKQLLYAIKQSNMNENSILDVENYSKVISNQSPTNRRLPSLYPDFKGGRKDTLYVGKAKSTTKQLKPIKGENQKTKSKYYNNF
jgi:hypothetical protein